MEANTRTPRNLFDATVCYEIPAFQRPYVWTEEDQWQPLWDDIVRVAEPLMGKRDAQELAPAPGHFLGAVVVKDLGHTSGDPARFSVIDGQQRLTTLQILIDAAQTVAQEFGDEEDAERLQELVLNRANRFQSSHKRFKLWPSRIDRVAFEHVMDNTLTATDQDESRIVQAHNFFRKAVLEWCETTSDPEKTRRRISALSEVLEQHLQIVAIDLSVGDDDQLIFETLNDRGTPLLAADLIKNYIFQRCEEIQADVDTWSEIYWSDFDDDWWRDEVAQGRLFRSRIDLFLQYWLTMRLREEIPTDAVFSRFRKYATEHVQEIDAAESFLRGLRADAQRFRNFTQLDPMSAAGSFYKRVVESLELGAFIPLLLWLISDNQAAPDEQAEKALQAVESWVVRRTLVRETMKDVNKLVVALLRELDQAGEDRVGEAVMTYLLEQSAESRYWPQDEQLVERLPETRVYGNVKQIRLRTILSAIELKLRSERHEDVTLPAKLDVEHIMPRGWRNHWGEDVIDDPIRSARREHLLHTLGNLTLVTQALNATLSNRPWTDAEAEIVAPTGKDAGLGKRSLLQRFSLLVLNKDVADHHPERWTEEDIVNRSNELAHAIVSIWPRG